MPSLEDMYYSIQDIANQVSRFRDSLDFEPNTLDEIENRLYVISKLKSKYGENVKDILEYCQKAEEELEVLENSSSRQNELENLLVSLTNEYNEVAHELTQKRKGCSRNIGENC